MIDDKYTVKSHFDPNEIKTIDEVVTLNSVVQTWKREKLIEEITDWMIPTFWALLFVFMLLLMDIFTTLKN